MGQTGSNRARWMRKWIVVGVGVGILRFAPDGRALGSHELLRGRVFPNVTCATQYVDAVEMGRVMRARDAPRNQRNQMTSRRVRRPRGSRPHNAGRNSPGGPGRPGGSQITRNRDGRPRGRGENPAGARPLEPHVQPELAGRTGGNLRPNPLQPRVTMRGRHKVYMEPSRPPAPKGLRGRRDRRRAASGASSTPTHRRAMAW